MRCCAAMRLAGRCRSRARRWTCPASVQASRRCVTMTARNFVSFFVFDRSCLRSSTVSTQLHTACRSGRTRVTKRLLALGADANRASRDGSRPLHIAAAHGNDNCVKLLLDVDAIVVDAADDSGRTALHVAALRAHRHIARRLLAAGAQCTLVRNPLCCLIVV